MPLGYGKKPENVEEDQAVIRETYKFHIAGARGQDQTQAQCEKKIVFYYGLNVIHDILKWSFSYHK